MTWLQTMDSSAASVENAVFVLGTVALGTVAVPLSADVTTPGRCVLRPEVTS